MNNTEKNISAKVPLSMSSYAAGKSPEQAVLSLKKAGFHYAELADEHSAILLERGPEAWLKFRNFAEENGLSFRQGHLPLHDDICDLNEERRHYFVNRHAQFCKMYHVLRITAAVLHSGGYDRLANGESRESIRIQRTESLKELLKDLPDGMTICLENLPYDTIDDMEADLDACGNPANLGLCLDTGHLHLCRDKNTAEFIRRAGKRLKALHLHDNVGRMFSGEPCGQNWYSSDKHMFPGFFSGSSQWKDIITALQEINYTGLWNLEVSGDLGADAEIKSYRELILRQDRERAELLFNLDFEAPQEGDPVNDFTDRKPLSSHGVNVSFSKWKIHLETRNYKLTVDPVRGGRISSWQIDGREILSPQSAWGWAIPSIWQPRNAEGWFKRGMLLENLKDTEDGFTLTFSRVIGEECIPLSGLTLQLAQKYTENEVTVSTKIINSRKESIFPLVFRTHSLFASFFPIAAVSFSDGSPIRFVEKQRLYRTGRMYPLVEDRFNGKDIVCDAPSDTLQIAMPDSQCILHVSCPGNCDFSLCF